MGKRIAKLLPIAFLVVPFRLAAQTSSVVQTVTVEVKPIVKIAVNGNPGALSINGLLGNADALSVSDSRTRYSMVTNLDNMKIVASINDVMPPGTRLMIKLESTKGVSNGPVDVSRARAPVNIVTGIGRGSDLNQTITYTFAANETVDEVDAQSRVIMLTLTD